MVNAGCADKDIAHLNHHLKEFKAQGKDVSMEFFSDQNSLVAGNFHYYIIFYYKKNYYDIDLKYIYYIILILVFSSGTCNTKNIATIHKR